jgi:hypothetical protein
MILKSLANLFFYNKQDILSSLPNEEPREFNTKYFEVKSLGDTDVL